MTHLEKHIAAVRSKLSLEIFINALAGGAVALSGAGLVAVIIDRFFAVSLPAEWRWPAVGLFGAIWLGAAFVFAALRRPTRHAAAVAIDAKLGLKERFATALFALPSPEPFAVAAVQDAREVARRVDPARHFHLKVAAQWRAAGVLFAVALACGLFMPRLNLFSQAPQVAAALSNPASESAARAEVKRALAIVSAAPQWRNEDELGKLVDELQRLNTAQKIANPADAIRRARRAIDLAQEPSMHVAGREKNGDATGEGAFKEGVDSKANHPKPSADHPDLKLDPTTGAPRSGRSTTAPDRAGSSTHPANGQNGNPNGNGAQPLPNGAGAGNANNPAGNNPVGNNRAANGNPPGQGVGKNNNGAGPAAPGERAKQAAPFAVGEQHSPSQDQKGGKIVARDLIKASAEKGEQHTTMAERVRAAQEASADEIDAEHVSGAAQSAARKYFRAGDEGH